MVHLIAKHFTGDQSTTDANPPNILANHSDKIPCTKLQKLLDWRKSSLLRIVSWVARQIVALNLLFPLINVVIPINRPTFLYSWVERQEIAYQVKYLLESDVIQENDWPFETSILCLLKPNGTLRMCIDYRGLNVLIRITATLCRKYTICLTNFKELVCFQLLILCRVTINQD